MIRTVSKSRLGTVLPCCPADTGFFSAVLSNTCSYCTSADLAAQQTLATNPNNQGNAGVLCCDPSAGFLANLFSNSCDVCSDTATSALGLPDTSSVPGWVWLAGAGIVALFFLKK